jgi:putative heme-binding domain-containing protein
MNHVTCCVRGVLVAMLLMLLLFPAAAFAQRNLKNIPDPDPELERKSFIVADGFEVNLFASDPRIAKPIQMNFDPQGRLWVASSKVYPHIKPGQKADDHILVLEDTDGDGKADKTTVFAGGLLIPTGVEPGDGGAYVANSTELLHFTDTNGDGVADKKRIVLSGFGTEDTHHILHTLRWGPEGFLYMNQSVYIHSHIESPWGVRRLNAGGIWRFRPETMQLKVYARGWVNPWGHELDPYGQSFVTDGAGGEGINYLVPGASYVTAFGAPRILRGLNPGSPKYCGLEIVGGRHLPKAWQGNLITNDFRGNRVCRFVVSEDGAGFSSRQMPDLIKTKHVAFRPIDIKMGPDGAIYIADWYNPIIQHGEVDFRDPRRDHVHGRIWRVTYKGRKLIPRPKLVGATVRQLLDFLKSPEPWTRQHARRVLKERGRKKVLPELAKWVAALIPKSPEYDHQRLDALWVYQSLRAVEPTLLESLMTSKDHRIRAAATRVVGYWLEAGQVEQDADWNRQLTESKAIQLLTPRVTDEHPRVRMEAVRVLATIPRIESATLAMRALDKPVDQFLDYALWLTARDLQEQWLPAVVQGKDVFDGNVLHLVFAAKAVGTGSVVPPLVRLLKTKSLSDGQRRGMLNVVASLGGPNELRDVFATAIDPKQKADLRAELLASLANAARSRNVKPSGRLDTIGAFFKSDSEPLRTTAIACAGLWRVEMLRPKVTAIATDAKEPEAVRIAAMNALAKLRGKPSRSALAGLSQSDSSFTVRKRAVIALCELDEKIAAKRAAALLSSSKSGQDPAEIVTAFLARRHGSEMLAVTIKRQTIPKDVAILALRTVSGSGRKHPALEAALRAAGKLKAQAKLTPKELAALANEVQKSGNAERGELVFRRTAINCQKCHSIAGAGGRVGPDLLSLGASAQVDYLIESLLEPNKKVKENYQTLIVADDNGKIHTGIKVRQTDRDLILRDAEDREIAIPLKSIEARRNGASIMPAGLTEQLTRRELVDLVKFLSRLGKVGKFAVGRKRYVRTWRTLVANRESQFRLRRTGFHTAAGDDPALPWQPAYSTVGGELPLSELNEFRLRYLAEKGHRGSGFARFHLNVTQPGALRLRFNSANGLTLWVGTKPQKLGTETTLNLPRGMHRITVGVDLKARKSPLRIELDDVPGSTARVTIVTGK